MPFADLDWLSAGVGAVGGLAAAFSVFIGAVVVLKKQQATDMAAANAGLLVLIGYYKDQLINLQGAIQKQSTVIDLASKEKLDATENTAYLVSGLQETLRYCERLRQQVKEHGGEPEAQPELPQPPAPDGHLDFLARQAAQQVEDVKQRSKIVGQQIAATTAKLAESVMPKVKNGPDSSS